MFVYILYRRKTFKILRRSNWADIRKRLIDITLVLFLLQRLSAGCSLQLRSLSRSEAIVLEHRIEGDFKKKKKKKKKTKRGKKKKSKPFI